MEAAGSAAAEGPTFEDLYILDTLAPLERVSRYVHSAIALQRLVHVRLLSCTAEEVGWEATKTQLVPLLDDVVMDAEPVVRAAGAVEIGALAEYCLREGQGRMRERKDSRGPNYGHQHGEDRRRKISGEMDNSEDTESERKEGAAGMMAGVGAEVELQGEGYLMLVDKLLPLLEVLLCDEDKDVRRQAVQVLTRVAPLIPPQEQGANVLTIALSLATDDEQEELRMTAAELFNALAEVIGPELCRQFIVPTVVSLAEDQVFRVRKATALNLDKVCKLSAEEDVLERILPAFVTLSNDDMFRVRKACAEALVDMSRAVSEELRVTCVPEIFLRLASDSVKAVRFAALSSLGPLLATMKTEDINSDLMSMYISLGSREWGDDNWNDRLQLHCAYNFPAVVLTIGASRWGELRDLYSRMCHSNVESVRRSLAASLHEVARLLGPDIVSSIDEDILTIFEGFCVGDPNEAVKVGAVRHLGQFLAILSPSCRASYVNIMQEIVEHAEPLFWRLREELARQLPAMVFLFSPQSLVSHVFPFALALMQDDVHCVRQRSYDGVVALFDSITRACEQRRWLEVNQCISHDTTHAGAAGGVMQATTAVSSIAPARAPAAPNIAEMRDSPLSAVLTPPTQSSGFTAGLTRGGGPFQSRADRVSADDVDMMGTTPPDQTELALANMDSSDDVGGRSSSVSEAVLRSMVGTAVDPTEALAVALSDLHVVEIDSAEVQSASEGVEEIRQEIVGFASADTYQKRQQYVDLCQVVARTVGDSFIIKHGFLAPLLGTAGDCVSNVRLSLCRVLSDFSDDVLRSAEVQETLRLLADDSNDDVVAAITALAGRFPHVRVRAPSQTGPRSRASTRERLSLDSYASNPVSQHSVSPAGGGGGSGSGTTNAARSQGTSTASVSPPPSPPHPSQHQHHSRLGAALDERFRDSEEAPAQARADVARNSLTSVLPSPKRSHKLGDSPPMPAQSPNAGTETSPDTGGTGHSPANSPPTMRTGEDSDADPVDDLEGVQYVATEDDARHSSADDDDDDDEAVLRHLPAHLARRSSTPHRGTSPGGPGHSPTTGTAGAGGLSAMQKQLRRTSSGFRQLAELRAEHIHELHQHRGSLADMSPRRKPQDDWGLTAAGPSVTDDVFDIGPQALEQPTKPPSSSASHDATEELPSNAVSRLARKSRVQSSPPPRSPVSSSGGGTGGETGTAGIGIGASATPASEPAGGAAQGGGGTLREKIENTARHARAQSPAAPRVSITSATADSSRSSSAPARSPGGTRGKGAVRVREALMREDSDRETVGRQTRPATADAVAAGPASTVRTRSGERSTSPQRGPLTEARPRSSPAQEAFKLPPATLGGAWQQPFPPRSDAQQQQHQHQHQHQQQQQQQQTRANLEFLSAPTASATPGTAGDGAAADAGAAASTDKHTMQAQLSSDSTTAGTSSSTTSSTSVTPGTASPPEASASHDDDNT